MKSRPKVDGHSGSAMIGATGSSRPKRDPQNFLIGSFRIQQELPRTWRYLHIVRIRIVTQMGVEVMEVSKTYRLHATLLGLSAAAFLTACNPLSEHEVSAVAGMNGGFEVTQNGLPVNWLMYTPNTVKDGEFQVVLDREIVKEGLQSLKFEVERCDPRGAARSPGFTNEFYDIGKYQGPGSYRVSFWIRSSGADFAVSAGPVSAKTGDMQLLIRDDSEISEWTQFEYTIDIPEERWLRMQLNVLGPGTLWIDDVRVTKVG